MLAIAENLAFGAKDLAADLRHTLARMHDFAYNCALCADRCRSEICAVDTSAHAAILPEAEPRDWRDCNRGQDIEDSGSTAAVQVVHAIAERGIDYEGEGCARGGLASLLRRDELDVFVYSAVPELRRVLR